MYPLMKAIGSDKRLALQVVATGTHVAKKFGQTHKIIAQDGFRIAKKLDILKFDDSQVGIVKSIGLGCSLFAKAFSEFKPDIVVVLGDRYELLSAVIAAYVARVAIAHIHGGETTVGAFDEGIRHSITKMASLHFPATEGYRHRIIQMGENPKRVFNFGAPGLDNLFRLKFLSKKELGKSLKFDLTGRVALVTFHPVTLENNTARVQIKAIFQAVKTFDLKGVFTAANADTHGSVINKEIKAFCRRDPQKYCFIESLGMQRYYSCLKSFDVMIGNSSSGLVEAPSFALPVVNIGDRQKNRIRGRNVIDSGCRAQQIQQAIKKALSSEFRRSLVGAKNPYLRFKGGKASHQIKEVLRKTQLNEDFIKKSFFDIKF